MSWIRPIEMNMNLSLRVEEAKWDNTFLEIAQKVALYTIIPFTLIAMFEAIVKNFIVINTLNLGITLLNGCHDLFQYFFGDG